MSTYFTYRLVGLKRLQTAIQAAPGLMASENAIALRSSVELVKSIAEANTPIGPGHFGYHLRERWHASVQVGLKRSIGKVSTDAPQGRWREFGTKAHDIHDRIAAFDTFRRQGGDQVLHHPGEKPRHALRKALNAAKPTIRAYFVGATLRVSQSMAGSGD